MTDAVYEPAYEGYEGDRTTTGTRVAAIARREWARVRSSTWLWVLLGVTAVHLTLRGTLLYFATQPSGTGPFGRVLQAVEFNAAFLVDAMATQARWLLTLALAIVASNAIARDLQAGGLTFHLTKPIPSWGYLAGKLTPAVGVGLAFTALPSFVLWVLGLAFAPSSAYPDDVALLGLTILVAGAIVSVVAALIVVALSAVTRSSRLAALTWIGGGLLLYAGSRVAFATTGNESALLVDLFSAMNRVVEATAGAPSSDIPLIGAALVTAGWALVSLAGLAWAIHREEVAG